MIGFKKLSDKAFIPSRSSSGAAGLDIRSPYKVVVPKKDRLLIHTDLAVQLPPNTYGRLASRSGLALKNLIQVAGGVIDSDFRGNLGVILYNYSNEDYTVEVGDKICQLICEVIVTPTVKEISDIEETERGSNGFGSTGK